MGPEAPAKVRSGHLWLSLLFKPPIMKNQLSLHEAIIIALVNIDKQTFAATFAEIAAFIEKRGLYEHRKGGVALATQVMLRATKANGAYSHLFTQVSADTIQMAGRKPLKITKKEKPVSWNGVDLSRYKKDKKPVGALPLNERILR